jgi:hypothetical protein
MNYTIQAQMESRRRSCPLCRELTYSDTYCATCKVAIRLGKTIKTATANYRQRNGILEIKRTGETRFSPLAA